MAHELPRAEAIQQLLGRIERQRLVVDRALTRPARWRGPIRCELLGQAHPLARARIGAAFDRVIPEAAAGRSLDLAFLLELRAALEPEEERPRRAVLGPLEAALGRAGAPAEPAPLAALRLWMELALLRPFTLGNGRISRLAASCVLARAGFRSTLFTAVEQHARFAPRLAAAAMADLLSSGGRTARDRDAWLLAALRSMADHSALAAWRLEHGPIPRRRLRRWARAHPHEAHALEVQLARIRREEAEDQGSPGVGRPPSASGAARAARVGPPAPRHPGRTPRVTVVVPSYADADTIAECLRGLRSQDLAEPFETIVVASGGDATVDIVRRGFPEVRLLGSAERLAPGAARNAGVREARGEVVAFLASDCVPEPDWLRRRLEHHDAGHSIVGGTIEPAGADTPAGRAQFLAKFAPLLAYAGRPPRVGRGPLFHLSYRRDLLDRAFPEGHLSGEDTLFNEALVASGHLILFDPAIRVSHLSERTWAAVLDSQRDQGAAAGALSRTEPRIARYFARWIRRWPPFPALRTATRALWTVARHRPGDLPRSLRASPLVVLAIRARVRAFRRAYRGLDRPLAPSGSAADALAVPPVDPGDPVVTAVVAAYQEGSVIARCLDSLLAQSISRLEVVVADDGSRDRTAAIAESRAVRVLRLDHRGPALARNAGAEAARGQVVAFVDADLELEPDCLERLVGPILSGRATGTFSKDLWVANRELPWAACWTLNRGFPEGHVFPRSFPDVWSNYRAIRRDAFLAVGGYDDVGYGEDMTLAPKLGELAVAVPGAVMWHHNPSSLGEVWSNAVWIGRGVRVRELDHVWRRYAPWRSVARGIRVAVGARRPRFVPFKLVFDAGVLAGYAASRLRPGRHWK